MTALIGRFNCTDLYGVVTAGGDESINRGGLTVRTCMAYLQLEVMRALIGRFKCIDLYGVVTAGGDESINREV